MREKKLGTPRRSNADVIKQHSKMQGSLRSKSKSRSVRSFHPNTLSIPADETIGVLQGKITYTEVIDAVTGDILGVPNMDVVRETMRPTNDPACKYDGEYYIADFRSHEDQDEFEIAKQRRVL